MQLVTFTELHKRACYNAWLTFKYFILLQIILPLVTHVTLLWFLLAQLYSITSSSLPTIMMKIFESKLAVFKDKHL